jgi:FAD/FMN-containing dehydrogenase
LPTLTHRPPHVARSTRQPGDSGLARKLAAAIEGEVLFGAFDRGRHATDASLYQIEPLGVIRPRHKADIEAAIGIAREEGLSLLARGGGTSQAGQTVGRSVVVDNARWLTAMHELDLEARTVWVEPGLVLDDLNRALAPHGLFYPVDVSTASRATLGGMTANNSCGSRSLRYGVSVDNVLAIEALTADGQTMVFGAEPACRGPRTRRRRSRRGSGRSPKRRGARSKRAGPGRRARSAATTSRRCSKTAARAWPRATTRPRSSSARKARSPTSPGSSCSCIACRRTRSWASAGSPHSMPRCARPRRSWRWARPASSWSIAPSSSSPRRSRPFQATLGEIRAGEAAALLITEFAGDDAAAQRHALAALHDCLAELGHPGAVVDATSPGLQARVTALRTAGLNIVMSMKGDAKPVSFVEDCAVPLAHLADYTAALTEIFARHGTHGTWYAHAAVGCLHVRPVLNLKEEAGARTMRAIAEETLELVQRFRGSHSGEHGDGLVRSEWHPRVFGEGLARLRSGQGRLRSRRASSTTRPRRSSGHRPWTTAGSSASRRTMRQSPCRSPRRSTGRPGAACCRRSRCATTTAPAGRWPAASCARAFAPPGTRPTSPAAAPTCCAWRSRASSVPTRSMAPR